MTDRFRLEYSDVDVDEPGRAANTSASGRCASAICCWRTGSSFCKAMINDGKANLIVMKLLYLQ